MPDSTEAPPAPETPHPADRRPSFSLGGIALAAIAILIVVALLLPSVRQAPRTSRRNQCQNNLKQIILGILNYESANGAFPPAYTVDAEGRRLHSWRTLILPYMEHATLYKTIDLSKPWDDPANAQARASESIMGVFACPSTSLDPGFTTYLAVVGPHSVFAGPVPRQPAEVTDDRATVLTVVDAPADRAVHWMSPYDISDEDLLALDAESKTNHAGVLLAAYLNGHVGATSKDVDAKVLRALVTIDGGEAFGE